MVCRMSPYRYSEFAQLRPSASSPVIRGRNTGLRAALCVSYNFVRVKKNAPKLWSDVNYSFSCWHAGLNIKPFLEKKFWEV